MGEKIKSVRAGPGKATTMKTLMPASFRDEDQPLLSTSGANPWCDDRKTADNVPANATVS